MPSCPRQPACPLSSRTPATRPSSRMALRSPRRKARAIRVGVAATPRWSPGSWRSPDATDPQRQAEQQEQQRRGGDEPDPACRGGSPEPWPPAAASAATPGRRAPARRAGCRSSAGPGGGMGQWTTPGCRGSSAGSAIQLSGSIVLVRPLALRVSQ